MEAAGGLPACSRSPLSSSRAHFAFPFPASGQVYSNIKYSVSYNINVFNPLMHMFGSLVVDTQPALPI